MSSSRAPSKHKWVKTLFHRGSAANSTGSIHGPEPAVSNEHSNASQPSTQAKLLETLQISGRFSQSVLPKLAECIDENPAKMAFNILNAIMDVRKHINDNKDELQNVLEETLKLLSTVFAKMEVSSNPQSVVNQTIEQYKREVSGELDRIKTLNDSLHSTVFHKFDYENYKDQLKDISRKIGGATSRFNVAMAGTTGIMVDKIHDINRDKELRGDLQPSEMADHLYIHDGEGALRREVCSEGTRINILNEISKWANDSSEGSPPVFWLTGQAGSGKTTIAYTITKIFTEARPTSLGANFLCSRQFPETRNLQRIVPTIVFQLAQNCTVFGDALRAVKTTGAVHSHTIGQQIEKFLFQPWKERKRQHGLPVYLVVIDALDEIEDTKGSSFLEELLKSIRANNITGLKFLVTSRPDPDIVDLCKTFPPGAVCQLQDVPIEDAKRDIKTYLDIELKTFSGTPEMEKLNEQAAGLFIYASTVVKILTGHKLARSVQLKRLSSLLSSNSSRFGAIDQLYQQIMRDAFSNLDDDSELPSHLSILYTFLCSVERISSSVAASLLNTDLDVAQSVLDNLHAVLYVRDNRVYWYHSSFPDFIFNHTRSNFRVDDEHFAFSCNPATQHGILSRACFRIMQSDEIGLRFNMGDIQSSYLLDSEHAEELHLNVEKNITPPLRYSCVHWAHHLSLSPDAEHEHICEVLSEFLQIRVLFWIEVMNLLGKSGDCSYLLQNAKRCVSKTNSSVVLTKDLQEVTDFAMHFVGCPAADSTPHLYISSLATWQSTLSLSKSWKDAFLGVPTYKNTKGSIHLPLMTKQIEGSIWSVTFSIDGTQVVAATATTILVLDATTGRQQRVLNVEHCRYVKFSRNGTRLVARSFNEIHIWDTSTYQLLKKFDADYATMSIEGTQILTIKESIDAECQVQVLDVSTGTILSMVNVPLTYDIGSSVSFSSVAKRFLIVSSDSVQIWDISIGCTIKAPTLKLEAHTSDISSAAFSPDAKHIVTSSWDGTVRVWDASTGNSLMVLPHKKAVLAFDFSPDGTHIVSISREGPLHVWDTTTGAELKVFTSVDAARSVAFSPDGTRIITGSDSGMQVWSWDRSAQIEDTQDIKGPSSAPLEAIIHVAMTDDSKKIMSATLLKIQIWDAVTGTELKTIWSPAMISSVNISGNGEYIVSCQQDESVVVWDATTGDQIIHLNGAVDAQTYPIFAPVVVGLSRSGKRIATGSKELRMVEIWNIQTGEVTEIVIDNPPFFLSFSTEEHYIVCGSVHGSRVCITTYNTLTGDISQEIYSRIACDTFVEPVLSTNGKEVIVYSRLLSGPTDTLFEIWDISSGQLLNRVKASSYTHDNFIARFSIESANLSNDGKMLVAGYSDGFIRILDVLEDGRITVIGSSKGIPAITFSCDDKRVVSGSRDGSVRVWDLDKDTEESWALQESGWITSSRKQEHRLMWVSESLRVIQPRNTLIISPWKHGSVDFNGATFGEDWEKCYTLRDM